MRCLTLASVLLAGCAGPNGGILPRVAIDTAIDIPAPTAAVWEVLADTPSYADWNPYHVRVDGTLVRGAKLAVAIEKPDGRARTVRPRVLELAPERSLAWGGGPAGLFRGVHRFDLEPLTISCTRLHRSEVFSGAFVPFAALDAIEPGYREMNAALRERIEEIGAARPGGCRGRAESNARNRSADTGDRATVGELPAGTRTRCSFRYRRRACRPADTERHASCGAFGVVDRACSRAGDLGTLVPGRHPTV